MSTHLTYFWDHDREIVGKADVEYDGGEFVALDNVFYRFCVDTAEATNNPDHRYGMWSIDAAGGTDWTPIPKECFPKKFLMALMLLEVA